MLTHAHLKLSLLLAAAIPSFAVVMPASPVQQPAPQTPATVSLPAFEATTIKPVEKGSHGAIGFYCYPGGRVHMGFSSVKTILYFAYGMKDFQIAGGPDWIGTEQYNIEAVPPDSSPSRALKMAPFSIAPTEEQRQMLQSLLADRFAFKYHMESRDGSVYILTRGSGMLELHEPADKDADMRGGVTIKSDRIDGEARGINLSMAFLASQLTSLLRIPVIDQTGLTGRYDYNLPPDDPTNHDLEDAVFDAMHRLGLDLKKGRGPIDTLVIDRIERPTEN
jgi:uncharacterized protein (TIGR03435 family)